jgi:histidinol-phosphate aminotransferase
MAGARLAYAIASAPIIEDLKKIRFSFNPYSVNRLTQLAGVAAIEDDAYYRQMHQEIIATRLYAEKCLKELGFILSDSKANFVFARHPDFSGYDLYKSLKDMRILVRDFNKSRISDCLRITIGTKSQIETLLKAINDITGMGVSARSIEGG